MPIADSARYGVTPALGSCLSSKWFHSFLGCWALKRPRCSDSERLMDDECPIEAAADLDEFRVSRSFESAMFGDLQDTGLQLRLDNTEGKARLTDGGALVATLLISRYMH
jgi:hypothetical protein